VDGKVSGLSKGFLGALLSDLVVLPDNPPSTQLCRISAPSVSFYFLGTASIIILTNV
jgi:hypothetical protein